MKNKLLFLATLALLATPYITRAQDFHWSCGSGNWNNGNCWNATEVGSRVPGINDNAFINNNSASDIKVTYSSNLYPNLSNRLYSYTLDSSNTGKLTMELQGSQTLNVWFGTVGNTGTASIVQNSGDNYTQYLELGKGQTGNGSYYLNNGNLISSYTKIASTAYGASGTGRFIQSGGIHRANSLYVGKSAYDTGSSTGIYELNAGTLNTGSAYVWSGNSVFNQSGGIHNAQQYVRLDRDYNGGAGTYNLSGGTLNTRTLLNVGGVFNYTGGVLQISGGIQNDGIFLLNKGKGEIHEFKEYVYNKYNGILSVADGETAVFTNSVMGSGSFTGNGTKIFQDEYQPGSVNIPLPPPPEFPDLPEEPISYGLANGATFIGNVIFEDSATMSLFLLSNRQSDWLAFEDSVLLGGTLNLMLGLDEYAPSIGDSWDIIFGNNINGIFDSIISDAPINWGWDITYGADKVTLTAVEASVVPLPAAIWLFGSGVLGLFGVARRKTA